MVGDEDLIVEEGASLVCRDCGSSRVRDLIGWLRADDGTPRGSVFIPFAFYEAAANLLTNAALDPFGKIAEVKYCAVKLRKGGTLTKLGSYGGGQSYEGKATQA